MLIAREGVPFVVAGTVVAVLSWAGAVASPSEAVDLLAWAVAGLATLFSVFSVWFFRDPSRVPPVEEGVIVASADGRVLSVEQREDNPYTGQACQRIAIFMSPFNVHVNRAPVAGTVEEIRYHAGRFFVASLDKASEENERNAIIVRTPTGHRLASVQIAGLVARRIVCRIQEGAQLVQGERYGLIRFGSRMEHYFPLESSVAVREGDRVVAGETIIGRLPQGHQA